MRRLLDVLGFDRCGFAETSRVDRSITMLCSVAVNGVEPMPLGRFPEQLEWWLNQIRTGQTIVLPVLPEDLPPEAVAERVYVERVGMRSHVSIPLTVGGQLFGAIGFAAFRRIRGMPAELIGRIKTIGEVLAVALARSRAEAELQRLRTDLWHSDRAASAGALTGSLAHELNQPLAAILSNAQAALRFLDRGAADQDEILNILEAIVREGKRAGAVIRSLRALLRREEVPRARIDLAEAISEVLMLMHGELEEQGVRVDTRFEARCMVFADKTQLQQVAVNLIKNAIDAMRTLPRSTRKLCVGISHSPAGAVSVAVRDGGIGIAADKLASVFQPFRTTKDEGMGLGLSIARAIVEAHGGEIRVDSNEEGGVTFSFSLPPHAATHEGEVARDTVHLPLPVRAVADDATAATTIWIVDDDPAVREALTRLLTVGGFAVEAFASAEEFLETSRAREAECMLLDVWMGGMTGPELCVRLREQRIRVPVVFLTGHDDVPAAIDAMKLGAVDYLIKPVDDAVLMDTVRQAVQRHTAERARNHEQQAFEQRAGRLSPRERDVMQHVVRGRLNKQIAAQLGISEKTVKQHRGRVMEKMEVRSLAELVRVCESVASASAVTRLPGDGVSSHGRGACDASSTKSGRNASASEALLDIPAPPSRPD
jgi:RNA polymerase sigma factor (sigma-70 family)